MNIESKRFKIQATGIGGYNVTNKETKETKYVPSADIPSAKSFANYLSAISESKFDKEMEELMELSGKAG